MARMGGQGALKTGLAETWADSFKCANHLGHLGVLGFLLLKKEIM